MGLLTAKINKLKQTLSIKIALKIPTCHRHTSRVEDLNPGPQTSALRITFDI